MTKPIRRLLRTLLERRGYLLGRAADAVLLPRPKYGPDVFTCAGIDWNPSFADAFLPALERLAPELAAFPRAGDGDLTRYRPDNPYFSIVDAAVCHALVRERAPDVVVEVGSGFSSRVLRSALDLNGRGRLVCVDPEPRSDVSRVAHEVHRRPVEELPLSFFTSLPERAVLFIDSSHRAGTGSDVNFLLLEVLPSLPPGVLVHVHDIYLPEDYPQDWNVGAAWCYSEQYLLHALLAHTTRYRVLWPGRRLARERRDALLRLLPLLVRGERPAAELEAALGLHCSFWMETL